MGMMFGLPLLSGVPTRTTEVPECRMSGEMVRVVERFTLCDPTKAESGKTICKKKRFFSVRIYVDRFAICHQNAGFVF